MATKMTKGKTRGNAAVLGSNQYLKKGGKVKKYAMGGPGDDLIRSAGTGDKIKMLKALYDKFFGGPKKIDSNIINRPSPTERKPEKKLLAKKGGKIKSKK